MKILFLIIVIPLILFSKELREINDSYEFVETICSVKSTIQFEFREDTFYTVVSIENDSTVESETDYYVYAYGTIIKLEKRLYRFICWKR